MLYKKEYYKFVTNGSINDVVDWYLREDKKYHYVCLLVTGSLNDTELLTEIYNHRYALHTITSDQIAFIVFSDKLDEAMQISTDPTNSRGKIFPGKLIYASDDYPGIETYGITEFTDESIKDNIIRSSQSVSSDILK